MKTQLKTALKYLLVMTILTGIIYPLLMTGLAQICFPVKANGSLIKNENIIIGSELIGQKFDSSIYFWSRPSAINYNPVPSGASNYGPTSDTLRKLVTARRILFAENNSISDVKTVPKEMVFASASGLDPHISPESALMQVERISKARNLNSGQTETLKNTIKEMTEKPQLGFLGIERINVLKLNLALNKVDGNLTKNQ